MAWLIALFLAWNAAASTAPPQRPTFRVDVDLATVDVAVMRERQPVAGLTAADFELFDNGARQKIERVLTEEVPLEATLVLDMSGSVAGQHLRQLVDAADAFTSGLRPQDRVSLVLFSHRLAVPLWLNAFPQAVPRLLANVQPAGMTALYDAAFTAVRLREPSANRGVVVVFTDGYDNASWVTPTDVEGAVERSDVIVYGVTTTERWQARVVSYAPQDRFLRDLARRSGGAVFAASWDTSLRDAFRDVLNHIRARYVLAYAPRDRTPGWHRIEVRLVKGEGKVIARRGYSR